MILSSPTSSTKHAMLLKHPMLNRASNAKLVSHPRAYNLYIDSASLHHFSSFLSSLQTITTRLSPFSFEAHNHHQKKCFLSLLMAMGGVLLVFVTLILCIHQVSSDINTNVETEVVYGGEIQRRLQAEGHPTATGGDSCSAICLRVCLHVRTGFVDPTCLKKCLAGCNSTKKNGDGRGAKESVHPHRFTNPSNP